MTTLPLRIIQVRPAGAWKIFEFEELWSRRELLLMLVWRVLKVRYKQTVLGASWAIVQPFVMMCIFTVFFGLLTRVPSDGIPYPLFVYCGLLVWQFVSGGFTQASFSVVGNPHLVTKIAFPRVLLPLAAVLASLIDLAFAFPALLALMIWFGGPVSMWGLLFFPFTLLLAIMTMFGMALWFAAMYVFYRDIAHLLPFVTQIWMFLSPIIYPVTLIPERFQALAATNPMLTVILGVRWAFAGGAPPEPLWVAISFATALIFLVFGYREFRRREPFFSDIV